LVTRLYTAATDNLVRALVERASRPRGPFSGSLALVAVGGYGRKELCPHSDIDLLVLTPPREQQVLEDALREVLYPLWDLNLKVGHSSGTVRQILASADGEFQTQTALLDARFLAGNRALFEGFSTRVRRRIPRWRKDFSESFRRAALRRDRRWGSSVFRLEPHIKEGRGALRDLHFLQWSGRVFRGLHGSYDLLLSGAVTSEHYAALEAAHDFLLRVRVGLHGLAGRRQDHLAFELQDDLARWLGFRRSAKSPAAERLMGEYYRHAQRVARITTLYQRRLTGINLDLHDLPVGEVEGRDLPPGPWRWFESHVLHSDDRALKDPETCMGLFGAVQQPGARLHVDTTEALQAGGATLGRRIRSWSGFGSSMHDLMNGERPYNSLLAMYRGGLLERVLPEFAETRFRAQHSRLHLYTVDVHLLYAVRELQAQWTGEGDWPDEVRRTASSLARRAPVVAATLLHDVAKKEGARHCRIGAEWATAILGRWGWDPEEVKLASDLVRVHLVLPATAINRDLSDPSTIDAFLVSVPSVELLDGLLCLVAADSRATNPNLAGPWRLRMYLELWRRARARLMGGSAPAPPDPVAWRAVLGTALAAEVPPDRLPQVLDRMERRRFAAAPEFLAAGDVETAAVVASLLGRVLDEGAEAATHHVRRPDLGVGVLHVASADRAGLFADQCAVLAARGWTVHAAEIASHDSGTAINTFVVAPVVGVEQVDPRAWKQLLESLEAACAGRLDLRQLLRQAQRVAPEPAGGDPVSALRVRLDHEASKNCLVVDVMGKDRPGLLHGLARVFARAGLGVRSAHITTAVDEVRDSFYLVDRKGRKPADGPPLRALAEGIRGL
jgi:[protein-PII] uridylyltransferase